MKSKICAKFAGMSAHDQRRSVIWASMGFWIAVIGVVLKTTL